MKSLFAVFLVSLAIQPMPSLAEGARMTFACHAIAVCSADGLCANSDGQVEFVTKPVNIGPSGEGTYTITYDGATFAMRNIDGTGPLLWSEGRGDAQVLLLTSQTTLLWQNQDSATGASELTFLTCEITQ